MGDRSQNTLWNVRAREDSGHGHSTQKPVECMARAIRNHDAPEVYDPFVGSGTTIIAAEMTGRACYAMEIAEIYCDVSVLRWEKFTGREATLEETGETFAHVAERRKAEDRTSDTPHQPRAPKTSVHSTGTT